MRILINSLALSFLAITLTSNSAILDQKNILKRAIEKEPAGLPKNIWTEISKWGVDKNATSAKDIFKNMDNIRLTSKTIKQAVDDYVQSVGLSKGIKDYTYAQFKTDLYNDLIKEWDEKINKSIGSNAPIDKQIETAIKLNAFLWSKDKAKKDKKYLNLLNVALFNFLSKTGLENEKIKFTKNLLDLGANPNLPIDAPIYLGNIPIPGGFTVRDPILFDIVENQDISILKLILEYGFDINIDYQGKSLLTSAIRKRDLEIIRLLLSSKLLTQESKDKALYETINEFNKFSSTEIIKLLLSHGANPGFKYENLSALVLAKNLLNKKLGVGGRFLGTSETDDVKKLKEIVKILEEAVRKPYYGNL